ncbi:hypothetical protein [Silvibacterium acidisoli]|uniref:hypothetical protein n=1 Tax=Acidobacteriaceae bacterium ZG23-2 TaxID=2883246 RepID=UPI00406D3D36
MIINEAGLFSGERLANCSDEAQLHWPRLMLLSNGFGRVELNAAGILRKAYASLRKKPTPQQLSAWIKEYQDNFLLFVYRAPNGAMWGQWMTPQKALKRFKTQADRESPAPDEAALQRYQALYVETIRSNSLAIDSFHEISETCGNLQKDSEERETVQNTSEECGKFPLGVGVGVGVGVGKNKDNYVCAEASSAPTAPKPKIAGTLPVIDGSDFEITVDDLVQWRGFYPALDIDQQFRSMKSWLISNPKNRKTRSGMTRFIDNWLRREQDRAPRAGANGGYSHGSGNRAQDRTNGNRAAAEAALAGLMAELDGGTGGSATGFGERGDTEALRETPAGVPN